MIRSSFGSMLPRGCYLIHHVLILALGIVGVTGRLAPSLAAYPAFGISLSIGFIAAAALGVYARLFTDIEVEMIALRMMSILCVAWSGALLDQLILGASTNYQACLLYLAQAAVLWGLANGIKRGLAQDAADIQQFIFVLNMTDETTPDGGQDHA